MSVKHQQIIRISLIGKSPEETESVKTGHNDEQSDTVGDVIIQSFTEYCDNSSIVGLKYLRERKRPFFEKFFWVCVFFVLIYSYIHLTRQIWDKWNDSPVIVTFDDKSTPVWMIPFPAVTICSEVKVQKTKFNFSYVFDKFRKMAPLEDDEYYNLQAFLHVCDIDVQKVFRYMDDSANAYDYVDVLDSFGIHYDHFNDIFTDCEFRGKDICDLFYPFLTEEGICFTFNSPNFKSIYREESQFTELDLSDKYPMNSETLSWSLDEGFQRQASNKLEHYPYRTMGGGIRAGLSIQLTNVKIDFDSSCRRVFDGFKILLHTPGEIPRLSKKYTQVSMNQHILISVKPTVMTTSRSLKSYAPHTRQCYFEQERYLQFFKVYTQANCELECLTNYTLSKCNCVTFSMPRNPATPVCGPAKIDCYRRAEFEVMSKEFLENIDQPEGCVLKTVCNCLPSCTSISYNSEISTTKFTHDETNNTLSSKNTSSQMVLVRIFFKENQFIASKRSELFGLTDFLANVGGLLGLFLGISAIAVAELAYFVIIRFNINLFKRYYDNDTEENGSE